MHKVNYLLFFCVYFFYITILVLEFYGEHKGKSFFDTLVNFMSSDFIVGMELVGDNSIKRWRELLGPTNT